MTLFRAGRLLRLALTPRHFSVRRLFAAVVFLWALLTINALVSCCRALDHVLFPGFKNSDVESPIFVIANPRSGTTFMHRLMCLDEERFTFFRLWQTILPSVTLYKLVAALSAIDSVIGRPMGRSMRALENFAFKGWDGVHAVGLDRAEEEEFMFLVKMLTPTMFMFFPFMQDVGNVDFIDQLPEERRRRVMRYYKESLRRHVYAVGGGRVILSKNVFFAGRLNSIKETFPGARFVHLVRHPYNALPSLVSMFAAPWRAHSPEWGKTSPQHRYWTELGIAYYRAYLEHGDMIESNRFIALTYDELVADPKTTIERVYDQLEIPMSAAFTQRLRQETQRARQYRSSHAYSLEEYGLEKREIYEALKPVFERYDFDADLDAEPSTSQDNLPPSVGDEVKETEGQREPSGVHGLLPA
ncbi:MAG: hypothetical protein ACI81R_001745 [Bradymonadia bacterium]|jgi:hypothetical protein